MPTHERGDDPLHDYWRAVADDPDAPAPDGIDPFAPEMVRGLRSLRAPEPDPAFVARLGERLRQEATRPATIEPAALAAPARPLPGVSGARPLRRTPDLARRAPLSIVSGRRRPVLAGLATAAVVILAVIALQVWTSGTQTVSATAILEKAGATGAGTSAFRSFAITEVSEQYPAALAGSDDLVRSEITRWYEAPGRWRREVISTVLGADGEVKSRGGLVSVSDGGTVWIHRLRDNTVIVRAAGAAGADELGPFPEVTGGLSGLLSQAATCYTPRLAGGDTIAGRSAHVVELGRSRCAPGADAGAGAELVEWTVWVDKETFVILKSVQEVDGAIAATTTVTSIEYNAPQDAARFGFTPPAGAKVRDQRQ